MRTKITLNTDTFHAVIFVETHSFLWFSGDSPQTLWKTMLFQKVSTPGNQIKLQLFIQCYIHESYQERNLLELKMETVPCSVRDTVFSIWYTFIWYIMYLALVKVRLSASKQNSFYLPQWNPFKNDENCFYYILKALFVLKIFKFLSWLFGHVEKTAWLES